MKILYLKMNNTGKTKQKTTYLQQLLVAMQYISLFYMLSS